MGGSSPPLICVELSTPKNTAWQHHLRLDAMNPAPAGDAADAPSDAAPKRSKRSKEKRKLKKGTWEIERLAGSGFATPQVITGLFVGSFL